MSIKEFQRTCENIAKRQLTAGQAARGKIQAGVVNVNGRLYPYDVAVPVSVHDGSYVYVHISDNKAIVIGA